MKKVNNFDGIAPVYDILSFLVFGKSIKTSQLYFLNQIPLKANVLIIGGGSGAILQPILERAPEARITYIELSEVMIRRSKRRIKSTPSHHVEFIQRNVHHFLSDFKDAKGIKFDVVITNFFLDVMNSARLQSFMDSILKVVTKDCIWLCTDFRLKPGANYLKRAFVKFMYSFFKVFSNLEGNSLLPFEVFIKKAGFEQADHVSFYFGLINSCVYKRISIN